MQNEKKKICERARSEVDSLTQDASAPDMLIISQQG